MKNVFYCSFFLVIAFAISCSNGGERRPANATVNENIAPSETVNITQTPPPASPLEKELYYVKNNNFRQVLVFSRKDGGKLTGEDIEFFKQYAPTEQINQRLKSGDDKYLVAGTNFAFQPEQLEALRKRFVIEDFTEKYGRK